MLGFGKKKARGIEGILDHELPSFSASVVNLLEMLRNPDCSFAQLAEELETDPGLHVRVLKTVNSAAFGLSHKVSNLHHAISLLGRARLESLVLSVAVRNNLGNGEIPDWFDMRRFWQTAARRAALARSLAQRLHPSNQSECFTAGLLQDMAVPILARYREQNYRSLYDEWNGDPSIKNLSEYERQLLQLDHAEIGAQMAKNWGFPPNLIEMIGSHHLNLDAPASPLAVRVVSLIKDNQTHLETVAEQVRSLYAIDPDIYCELAQKAEDDAVELAEALI